MREAGEALPAHVVEGGLGLAVAEAASGGIDGVETVVGGDDGRSIGVGALQRVGDCLLVGGLGTVDEGILVEGGEGELQACGSLLEGRFQGAKIAVDLVEAEAGGIRGVNEVCKLQDRVVGSCRVGAGAGEDAEGAAIDVDRAGVHIQLVCLSVDGSHLHVEGRSALEGRVAVYGQRPDGAPRSHGTLCDQLAADGAVASDAGTREDGGPGAAAAEGRAAADLEAARTDPCGAVEAAAVRGQCQRARARLVEVPRVGSPLADEGAVEGPVVRLIEGQRHVAGVARASVFVLVPGLRVVEQYVDGARKRLGGASQGAAGDRSGDRVGVGLVGERERSGAILPESAGTEDAR